LRSRFSLADRLSSSLSLAVVLLLLIATPGHPASVLRGFPLEPIVTSIVLPLAFLVWAGWSADARRWQGWLVMGLLVITSLKVVLALDTPEPGATAFYFGRARLTDPPERSLDFRHLRGATRIDRVVDFDQYTLPVGFFNDNDRFNYYEPDQPDRQRLALATAWNGWLTVPETRQYRLWISAIGDASLLVDGGPALRVDGGRSGLLQIDARPMELTEGPHEIRLEYQRRQGSPAQISLDWDVHGDREPVGPPYLYTTPVPVSEMVFDIARGTLAWGIDLLAWLLAVIVVVGRLLSSLEKLSPRRSSFSPSRGSLFPWERAGVRVPEHPPTAGPHPSPLPGGEGAVRAVLGVWAALITIYGVVTSTELIGWSGILEGGQDWLTYEYYARDIWLNGPLMTLGKALGQGRAFVFQPLYPYYLALLHGMFGEGMFGPQVAHFAGFGIAAIIIFFVTRALFGNPSAWLAIPLMTVLIFTQLDVVARRLLSENLYFYVLPAAILAVLRTGREDGWRWAMGAGVLMGTACLTRAPTLLIVPAATVVLLLMRRTKGATIFTVVTCLVVGLAPLRNYIVSGQPKLVATNAGATLLLAHPLTDNVRLRGLDQHPVYNRLGLDRPTREILEFVIQDPVGYGATLIPLAAYTLGVPGLVEPGSPPAWELIGLLVLYLASVVLLARARQRETWLSHAFIASHFLVMITFLPYVYGYRQVLPMYVVMLPFSASLISRLFIRRFTRIAAD
jgi:hypothetical protein